MNRPFYAIGVLLAALAAAMLLVSATSKPRALQPAAAGPSGKGDWQPGPARGSNFVIVLAAADGVSEESAEPIATLETPTYELGCGLDRATGEVYPLLKPDAAAVVEAESAAGLTHYDPAYDAAVYGLAWDAESEPELLPDFSIEPELLEELDPALRLFRELQKERPDALRRPKVRRNRLAGTSEQPPTWADYEDWANSRQTVADQRTAQGNSPHDGPQQARRMVQIAVATLNHVAELLQAAADQLERSAADEIAATPAKAGSAAQPQVVARSGVASFWSRLRFRSPRLGTRVVATTPRIAKNARHLNPKTRDGRSAHVAKFHVNATLAQPLLSCGRLEVADR